MLRNLRPLLLGIAVVGIASAACAETWILPYLGTGDGSNSVGEVGSTLFAGDRWAAWAAARRLIHGVHFHEIATRTMSFDQLFQLVDAGEHVELTADEAAVYPLACRPDETAAAAYARDKAKWVARVPDRPDQSLVTYASAGRTFKPASIEIGEILNVKRGQCGESIADIRRFYRDYLLLIRHDFPKVPLDLAIKLPAAVPGLNLVPMIQSLVGFLCRPGQRPDVCPAAVVVDPDLFAPYPRVADQLVRLRNYVLDRSRHGGRSIAFDVFLVDECAFDPPAGDHIRERLVLDSAGTARCSADWGVGRSNWLPNILAMHTFYAHVFGTPDYAARTEISDWTDTFYDPARFDPVTRANPLVLGASDDTADTFMTGAKIAAAALVPGSIDRYRGTRDDWVGVEVPADGYYFDAQLGYVRGPGASEVELYSCSDGGHQFLSRAADCEGKTPLSFEGWLRTPAQPQPHDARPLYRCEIPGTGDRFASNSPDCDGQTSDGLLGYACNGPGSC